MSKRDRGRKLDGSWHKLHTAVWLIGLAILFWKGWWWPGILVLVAISMVIEMLLPQLAPQSTETDENPVVPPVIPQSTPQAMPAPQPTAEHRLELLPATCPNCSGPIRGHEVRWTGSQSADCPYCGTNLPMKKEPG